MTNHAHKSPSSMARIVQCPGSVKMCAKHPESAESEEAKEGTAAHWAWRELLEGRQIDIGLIAPNGIPLTDEMCEGAELFADAVGKVLPPGTAVIEQALPASPLIAPDNWGTPDVWGMPDTKTIYVADYKFGHSHVEVFRNWQLVNYALLILDMMGIDGHAEQSIRVILEIVQPRSYHSSGPVRRWECMGSDLRAQRNIIKGACELADRENAYTMANPECYHCSARAHCLTLERSAYIGVDIAGDTTPLVLSPRAMGLEWRILRRAEAMLKARRSGLEEAILSTIKAGGDVPGTIAERGNGRRAWDKPVTEIKALGDMMGVPLVTKPITPAAAIKAGIPADVIAAYTVTPAGALSLKEDDGSLAQKIFST